MLRVLPAILLCLFIVSCEDKDDDKTFQAQRCLDTATPATVDICVNMVAGISSNKSFVIRCSADFIRQNITNATIVQALEDLDDNAPGQNAAVKLYENFKFDTVNNAEKAVSNCQATGSNNLTMLAVSARMATVLTNINANITSINPNTVSADDLEDIGEMVTLMFPLSCGENGQFEGTDVCANLGTAINQVNANPPADSNANGTNTDEIQAEIAKLFIDELKN